MNLPNYLTISRLLFPIVVIIIVFLNLDKSLEKNIILVLFIFFSITDYLDGYLARKFNLVSIFGKVFDPISDKVLTASSLLYILSFQENLFLPALLILTREIIVSGIREYMILEKGETIDVVFLSKLKTTFQFVSIILFLAQEFIIKYLNIEYLAFVCIWITTILTLYTGFQYSYKAFTSSKKRKKK